jgi:quinoprotein glucose dehydrogenase
MQKIQGRKMTVSQRMQLLGGVVAALVILPARAAEPGWQYYGGDQGGQRYSTAAQIRPGNVTSLQQAWSYSTGDMTTKGDAIRRASFENTPILAGGRLFVCSPFDEVSALDPGTGKQIWRFDPRLDTSVNYPNDFICRGVAYWQASGAKGVCAERVYLATNDRRLIALDAATGKPCAGFGDKGTITIAVETKPGAPPVAYTTRATDEDIHRLYGLPASMQVPKWLKANVAHAKGGGVVGIYRMGEIQSTSAPIVSHGIVVVGSSIDDNLRVDELSGAVHAYDAMTGAPKWSFDPLADQRAPFRAGAANIWAPISADDARGLVYLPVSSASPDFWGGFRKGDGHYANSVTALNIETGAVVWSFQTTHHDVWDYDIPAQPTLGMVTYKGKTSPAVLQTTKQGLLFTLDAVTGKPFIPVEERKVPQGGAYGEALWPTQPFPAAPRPLAPTVIKADDAYGLTPWDRGACRAKIAGARAGTIYTPPSTQGTILYPFTGGGSNWGGIAFDPAHDIVYANTSSAMHLVTLIKAKDYAATRERLADKEVSPNLGAPFGMIRETVLSPIGMPCNPPPWGQLHAIDMHDGRILWSVTLGTTEDMAPFSEYLLGKTGTPNFGGPIVTASGLVFIGAAMDDYLRAFDAKSGAELWRGRLPAGGQATPMTYVWKGRQYVVIAAGGHSKANTRRGDQVVAFALP